MPLWPTTQAWANAKDLAAVLSTSLGTAVVGGTPAGTKGSWTTLIASTATDITHMIVDLNFAQASGYSFVLDLAGAPAASEANGLIIQNLVVGGNDNGYVFTLPTGPIPSGTRIAARVTSTTATDGLLIQAIGFDAGNASATSGIWDTYGYSSGVPKSAFTIDPGGTINTKGSYVAITASSTNDYAGFMVGFDVLARNSTGATLVNLLVDLALGAGGSEQVLMPNYWILKFNATGAPGGIVNYLTPVVMMPIAAGTRIAARAQGSGNVALDRTVGVSFYGLRA